MRCIAGDGQFHENHTTRLHHFQNSRHIPSKSLQNRPLAPSGGNIVEVVKNIFAANWSAIGPLQLLLETFLAIIYAKGCLYVEFSWKNGSKIGPKNDRVQSINCQLWGSITPSPTIWGDRSKGRCIEPVSRSHSSRSAGFWRIQYGRYIPSKSVQTKILAPSTGLIYKYFFLKFKWPIELRGPYEGAKFERN